MVENKYDLAKAEKKLKKYIDKERLQHTHGVMYTAACMAMVYGYDLEGAQIAGLLHDCAKCIDDEKKIKLCKKHDISLTEYELEHPFIIHAKLGAWIAKEKYHIDHEDILNAIRYHTTGREAMSDLEKIIFIADYIEPGRNKANRLDAIRKMAFTDLNETMRMILSDTLDYLHRANRDIDPMTEKAYSYYADPANS